MLQNKELILNTEQLIELLNSGQRFELVGIESEQGLFENYTSEEQKLVDLHRDGVEIVEIVAECLQEVQCIEVDDEDHLYLTDCMLPTHNTSNIIFLKSTDNTMIETLSQMSGTTHKVYRDSKTITQDVAKVFLRTEGKVSYTMSAKERPVISYNDMAYISERNSIVFRAGDSPIWNRNETILPMSWRLFRDDIRPLKEPYTLKTVPTLSSAKDFDVKKNQPDFFAFVEKRVNQAKMAKDAIELYKDVYGYNDQDLMRLDADIVSDEIMEIINTMVKMRIDGVRESDANITEYHPDYSDLDLFDNDEQLAATAMYQKEEEMRNEKIYANKKLSRSDIMGRSGVNRQFDEVFVRAYMHTHKAFKNDPNFTIDAQGSLRDNQDLILLKKINTDQDLQALRRGFEDDNSRVYSEGDIDDDVQQFGAYVVQEDFIRFLVSLDKWDFAGGQFDAWVAKLLDRVEN